MLLSLMKARNHSHYTEAGVEIEPRFSDLCSIFIVKLLGVLEYYANIKKRSSKV